MTEDYILNVDASQGVKVKVGDIVKKGMELGKIPDKKGTLFSPFSGIVSDIYFNPENHTLKIKIKSNLPRPKS